MKFNYQLIVDAPAGAGEDALLFASILRNAFAREFSRIGVTAELKTIEWPPAPSFADLFNVETPTLQKVERIARSLERIATTLEALNVTVLECTDGGRGDRHFDVRVREGGSQ